jgi:hypothetical protein
MIGLIDVDGILPNLALMKIAAYYKAHGERVEFVKPGVFYERVYASAILSKSMPKCEALLERYGDRIEIGGSGWDIPKRLPPEIEACKADYSLYSADIVAGRLRGIMTKKARLRKAAQIVDAGAGFTSRGCPRSCGFCIVPAKEGPLRQDQEIGDIINPRSKAVILHDNNFTSDPLCLDKLREIRERGLTVDINQGCDVRVMTDEVVSALASVNHLRSIHYAWDLMKYEAQVMRGIRILSKYVRPYRQMCYMLVGYDTDFEEDVYRFRKLAEMKIDPYVMLYNQSEDPKLRHFARWVNAHIYTQCPFEEYSPWILEQEKRANDRQCLLPLS